MASMYVFGKFRILQILNKNVAINFKLVWITVFVDQKLTLWKIAN